MGDEKKYIVGSYFSVIIIALLCQICGVFEFMGIFPPSLNAMEKKYQKAKMKFLLYADICWTVTLKNTTLLGLMFLIQQKNRMP